MNRHDKYCDDPSKSWIVICNGTTAAAALISTKNVNRDVLPELNFESSGKEFIIQFSNQSDLIAARDTGRPVDITVLSTNRSVKKSGQIKTQKIIL